MEELQHPDGRRQTPANEQERQALLAQGFRPAFVVGDTAPGGVAIIRSPTADEQAASFVPGAREATAETDEILAQRAEGERIDRDALSTENQVAFGASALGADVSLGLTTALGLDARVGLPDDVRERVRERTQGAEALGHVLGAVSPVGAEALISRGARWLGGGVSRFAAEGAAGGAFNALQEAAIARDPDVFAERLAGDMGVGALLGGGFGVPFSAGRGLARLARGTAAARANRGIVDAASDVSSEALTIPQMESLLHAAQNPTTPIGRLQQTFGGVAAPTGRRAEMDALERMLQRHNSRTQPEFDLATQGVSDTLESLRTARGRLADLDPNTPLPTRGMDPAAVRQASDELSTLARDLRAIDTPDSAVSSALSRISRALEVPEGATAQQALRSLYDSPRAIREATSGLSPVQMESLGAMVGSRGLSPDSSPMLAGRGFGDIQEGLDGLMTSDMWGEAGQVLSARRRLQQSVGESLDAVDNDFVQMGLEGTVRDSNALRRLVRQAENSGNVESLQRLAEASRKLDEIQGQSGLFPELDGVGSGLSDVRGTLDEFIRGSYAQALVKKTQGMEQTASIIQQPIRQAIGGAGLAAAAFSSGGAGVAGGLGVAGLAAVARSPFSLSRLYSRVRNAFGEQGARVARSLDDTTNMAISTSRTPFISRLSPRAGTLAAFTMNASREEKTEMYEEIVANVLRMQDNPTAMAEALQPQVEVLGESIPGLNTAMGMQGHRQLSALAAALPLSARTQQLIGQLSGPPPLPSATEMNEFLQVAAVVEDPIHGIDLMNAGRLSRGSAAAIATAFPNFHEEVTARIISDIARASQRQQRRGRRNARGPALNYQASLMMSRFVGFPLDSTMEAGFQAAMASSAAQTSEQDAAQVSRPASTISTREPTFLQQEMTVTGRVGS